MNKDNHFILTEIREKIKLESGFKTILFLIAVILVIVLLSILLFPELPRDISRMLTRLGIIPMEVVPDTEPPKYFDDSINSTLAGQPIEFRLRWTDNVSLSGYIFSLDDCTETLENKTWQSLSGTEDWSNVTYVINDTVGCTIRWKVYANDTSNNWNVSQEYSFITTEAAPIWSSNVTSPLLPSYSPGQSYQFNVTWRDNIDIDTVFIEQNFTTLSENPENKTMSNQSSEYYYNISDLPAGKYVWKSYANDTLDNWNSTSQWTYEIGKNVTEISLYLNGTRGNESYEPNQTANFTVVLDVPGKYVNLTANITGFGNETGLTPLMNYTNLTSEGIFNITGYWLGDFNYSSDSETWYATVSTSTTSTSTTSTTTTTIPINYIEVNGTEFARGDIVNITGWSDDSSSTTYLWNNYTGVLESMLPSGSGVQSNFTDTSNMIGSFNVSCNSTHNSTLEWEVFTVTTSTTTTTLWTTTTIFWTTTTIVTAPAPTTTVPACALTGEACSSDSDCCYGYCCDNVCSDEPCEEKAGLGMYVAIAVIGASIPTGYFIYSKFIRKRVPVKPIPVRVPYARELRQELISLRTITQNLRIQGYDVRVCDNELALAENALRNNLPELTKTHLNRVKQILRR